MTPVSTHGNSARDHVSDAVHKASPFVRKFARFGYAAKGVVYVIVGGLAAAAAFGRGGETTGSRGALQTVPEQPFGQVLLGIVGVRAGVLRGVAVHPRGRRPRDARAPTYSRPR